MALVVVDMQTAFPCQPKTIEAVCAEIRKARSRRETIYNVIYFEGGPVYRKVRRELNNGHYVEVIKEGQGGGEELFQALVEVKAVNRINHAKFVGIYTDMCVFDTAKELAQKVRPLLVHIFCKSCEFFEETDGAGKVIAESEPLLRRFAGRKRLPRNLKIQVS